MSDLLDYLATSPYAEWVDESWGWPLALVLHALGMALVVGLMAIISLRLFGVFRTIPYGSLRRFIPWIWFGFFVQVISGFTLWMSKPGQYLGDVMFDTKFTLVWVAVVVMLIFQGTLKREAAGWDSTGKVSPRGHKMVVLTFVAWAAVTVGGRLTAYLGTLYLR